MLGVGGGRKGLLTRQMNEWPVQAAFPLWASVWRCLIAQSILPDGRRGGWSTLGPWLVSLGTCWVLTIGGKTVQSATHFLLTVFLVRIHNNNTVNIF